MTTPVYFRRCPSCGKHSDPTIMRCLCGTLLAGVDLTAQDVTAPSPSPDTQMPALSADTLVCPYPDCAQPNPALSTQCVYCDRPLLVKPVTNSLINLPAALNQRYRITQSLPAKGAEAELLLVQANAGGVQLVAKIYRHGILPKTAIQERIARVDNAHRVDLLEYGVSDGYAYELMEFCVGGSLRTLLDQPSNRKGMVVPQLREMVSELALAVADIHANGLVHRDLKPENILIRTLQPLDLVLTDFGIASVLDVTQRYTGVAHTLPYAAPESLSGVIDAKADYWALGMIILEASTGQHPFKNLSDAVILHFLTTKNIATDSISNPEIAKLVRGLLLRDPIKRWGPAELKRWLAGDTALTEPQQNSPDTAQTYLQPYHLGEQRCYQPEQLGVALANHWEMGVTDLTNGLLLSWFRDVQKDQNMVRLLLEYRQSRNTSVDIQLLNVILQLAPGIPPVWHGQSIALSAILAHADAAIKGDEASIEWLNQLYQYRVLEIYAKAGNSAAAEIVQRWNKICDQFVPAWEAKSAIIQSHAKEQGQHQPVDLDRLMYGNDNVHRPRLAFLHAQILALCYDSNWTENKRQVITDALTTLIVQCPWLVRLGDPKTMGPAELLAIESLMPEMKKIAEQHSKRESETKLQQHEDYLAKGKAVTATISQIRACVRDQPLSSENCEQVLQLCADYFSEIAEIRASPRTDVAWQEMRKSALRSERHVHQLIEKINHYTEHQAINEGWLNQRTIGAALVVCVILLLPSRHSDAGIINPGSAAMWIMLGIATIFLLWRFLPAFQLRQQIKEIAGRL